MPTRSRTANFLTAASVAVVFGLSATAATQSGDDVDAGASQNQADAPRDLPPRMDGHRPLRTNPELSGDSRDPAQPFAPATAYGDVPAYSVVPRDDALSFYPCEDCHGMLPVNPERRTLYSPHPGTLDHGAGRIWCLDCHAEENRNVLQTFAGEEVEFNESYLVCGQCHYQPQKDWFFGAHGKRVNTWQGERELYNCAHCHNPHAPAVRPRRPEGPPPIRRGLQAQELHSHEPTGAKEVKDE